MEAIKGEECTCADLRLCASDLPRSALITDQIMEHIIFEDAKIWLTKRVQMMDVDNGM